MGANTFTTRRSSKSISFRKNRPKSPIAHTRFSIRDFQLRTALNHARANEDNDDGQRVSRYRNLESRGNVVGCMRTDSTPTPHLRALAALT